jgi:hypothetical protein
LINHHQHFLQDYELFLASKSVVKPKEVCINLAGEEDDKENVPNENTEHDSVIIGNISSGDKAAAIPVLGVEPSPITKMQTVAIVVPPRYLSVFFLIMKYLVVKALGKDKNGFMISNLRSGGAEGLTDTDVPSKSRNELKNSCR